MTYISQCVPVSGARCQRCARKDEVCRFVEVALDSTAPRPLKRGCSVASEVKLAPVRFYSVYTPAFIYAMNLERRDATARISATFAIADVESRTPLGIRVDCDGHDAAICTSYAASY